VYTNKDRIPLVMLTMTGFMLLAIGGLLAYYFNTVAVSMPLLLRLLGFAIGLSLVLVGGHILVAGIHTFKRTVVGGGGRS